jgi:hypothetical protein
LVRSGDVLCERPLLNYFLAGITMSYFFMISGTAYSGNRRM